MDSFATSIQFFMNTCDDCAFNVVPKKFVIDFIISLLLHTLIITIIQSHRVIECFWCGCNEYYN